MRAKKGASKHLYSQIISQKGGANLHVFRGSLQGRRPIRGGINLGRIAGVMMKSAVRGAVKVMRNPTVRKLGRDIATSAVKELPKIVSKKTTVKGAMKNIIKENKKAIASAAKEAVNRQLKQRGGIIGGRKMRIKKSKR
jgi:hypothetical protein